MERFSILIWQHHLLWTCSKHYVFHCNRAILGLLLRCILKAASLAENLRECLLQQTLSNCDKTCKSINGEATKPIHMLLVLSLARRLSTQAKIKVVRRQLISVLNVKRFGIYENIHICLKIKTIMCFERNACNQVLETKFDLDIVFKA